MADDYKALPLVQQLLHAVRDIDIERLKQTVQKLKTEKLWNSELLLNITLEEAIKCDKTGKDETKHIVDILTSAGAEVNLSSLPLAAKHQNVSLMEFIIQLLKATDRWDPEDINIFYTLQVSFKQNSRDIVTLLITEGVEITSAVLRLIVNRELGDVNFVKAIIHQLKSQGKWDPCDYNISAALVDALRKHATETVDVLSSEGAVLTYNRLPLTVEYNNLPLVKSTLQHMKYKGEWNPTDVNVSITLDKAIEKSCTGISELLISEGAVRTGDCLSLALEHGNATLMKSTIQHLKARRDWNPACKAVTTALEEATEKYSKDFIDVMVSEGATVTLKGLPWAIEYGNITLVKSTIQQLKKQRTWDCKNVNITLALLKSVQNQASDMTALLLQDVTLEVLPLLVQHGDADLIKPIILNLQMARIWNPTDANVYFALKESFKKQSSEIINLLIPHGAITSSVKMGDREMVNSLIQMLKEEGKWDSNSQVVNEALDANFEPQPQQIIKGNFKTNKLEMALLFLSEGVVTTLSLISAIRTGNTDLVRATTQGLKSTGKSFSSEPAVIAAVEKRFQHYGTLGKEDAELLISTGAINMRCLLAAVKNNETDMVKIAIKGLRSTGKWLSSDPVAIAALEETFHPCEAHQFFSRNAIADLLLSEGVTVTVGCLLSAIETGSRSLVNMAVEELKSAGKWHPYDPEIIAGLESCFKKGTDSTEYIGIAELLLSKGVVITTQCFLSAVINGNIYMVRMAIKCLKSTGKWSPSDPTITAATEEAFKHPRHKSSPLL